MRWIHISLSLASRGDEPEAVSLGETEVTDLSARCEDPEDFSICPGLQNLGCFLSILEHRIETFCMCESLISCSHVLFSSFKQCDHCVM